MQVGNRQNGVALELNPLSYSCSKRREMKSLPKADIRLICALLKSTLNIKWVWIYD